MFHIGLSPNGGLLFRRDVSMLTKVISLILKDVSP